MAIEREALVADHYGIPDLGRKILEAARLSGLDVGALTPADLAPIDEFHMGGRAATAHIIDLMGLKTGQSVLDIGSGLGGVARFLASERGCEATGVDLTQEFVSVARMLSDLTGLSSATEFHVGSALNLPFANARFDAATTFHVAMNIADRSKLYSEAARVIRPGGCLAIFDVMKGPSPGMIFPVPWAETEEASHLTSPDDMKAFLAASGFEIVHREDRTNMAKQHHAKLAEVSAAGQRPVLGLHLLQGDTAGQKSQNMIKMLEARQILLVGMIAKRIS
jgi:MPBQ/MSBQ methyltransferase